jgi:transposase
MVFVGDDWAEDHHDVELVADDGRRLARARLPEGVEGIARLHALIAEHLPDNVDVSVVKVGIETDRGPWVGALVAAGYDVFAINPLSAARYRERHSTSGAKSDAGDAHVLAEIVRLDRAHHRPVAGDSELAEATKLLARQHQTLIWTRQRTTLQLRATLLEFFPQALQAFPDLAAPDALELLGLAPDPGRAAKLTVNRVTTALTRARRRDARGKAAELVKLLRAPTLRQPATVEAAYGSVVSTQVGLIAAITEQISILEAQVADHFGRHPDAEIYLSQPGLGVVLGARVLAEFGDDPNRYTDAKARKNYSGQSPVTRASGIKKVVLARYARNRRLADALHRQAFCALTASPGARAYYDLLRERGKGHNAALRQLANRLVGILHGCLKTRTPYDEHTAWGHLVNGSV